MDRDHLLDRVRGGLYGQALGDAWAMPALLTPQDTWQRYGGWITEFLPGPEDHPFHAGLAPGRVTDDTEQAFALAEAILEAGQVTSQAVAQALLRWYRRVDGDRCPFIGPSTRRAIQAIQAGRALEEAGRFGDTNGAAMRIAPVGLIHPGDVDGAVQDAYRACVPTHHTDVAVSGAAAVAGAIAAGMVPGATLEEMVQAGMEAAAQGRALGPRWMGPSVARRIQMAVEIAQGPGPIRERIQELYDVVGTTLAIPESVPAAFGVLVLAQGDPRQTAVYAAALSGDADTIGAMACAMAGAWRGAAAIPAQVLESLRQANPELDFEGMAQGLMEMRASQGAGP